MSEKFIVEGWVPFKGELFSSKQTTLQRLIDEKPYPSALAALQQSKKDHGYTDEWYREHLWELNRQWLSKVQSAVIENNRCIAELNQKIVKVNDTRFRYNYTEKELADLQFMQTLIKTRILNEGKKDLTQSLCILDEYIDTQEGARAIMFLSADNEVGKYAKVRYEVASKNAKTAAERAFDADKAAKLDSLQSQLLPYMQAAVIGNKMLERAEQQVSRDMSERAGTIYFQDTSVSVDNAVRAKNEVGGRWGYIPYAVDQQITRECAKQAESTAIPQQSPHEDSVNSTLSQRETSEIAVEDISAVTTTDSTENSEKRHESRQSKSNFANVSIL